MNERSRLEPTVSRETLKSRARGRTVDLIQAVRGLIGLLNEGRSGRLVRNYLSHDGDALATLIAFNALFSLFPLLLMVYLAISALSFNNRVREQIEDWVAQGLPPSAFDPILDLVNTGRANVGQLGLITLIGLLFGGARLFGALDRAFATIYSTTRRPFLYRRAMGLLLALLTTLLIVVTTLAGVVINVIVAEAVGRLPSPLASLGPTLATYVSTVVFSFVMMWLAYALIPYPRQPILHTAPGAAVAAVLFGSLGQLFPLYVYFFGNSNLYTGVFAFILVLMFWLYIAAQIVVVGAEINALFGSSDEERKPSG
jgi:membrane protein